MTLGIAVEATGAAVREPIGWTSLQAPAGSLLGPGEDPGIAAPALFAVQGGLDVSFGGH